MDINSNVNDWDRIDDLVNWDRIDDFVNMPGSNDAIINQMLNETPEQKTQRVQKQRQDQSLYEFKRFLRTQDGIKAFNKFKDVTMRSNTFKNFIKRKKEYIKNVKKIETLRGAAIKIEEELQNQKKEASFNFTEPVPGCQYELGNAFGSITVPMNQTNMREFIDDMLRYSSDIVYQLQKELGTIEIYLIAHCIFYDQKNELEISRTVRTENKKILSWNDIDFYVYDVCHIAESKLLVHQNKSGLTFDRGVLFQLIYRRDVSKNKREGKRGKKKV